MKSATLSNSVGAPPAGRQSWLRTLGWAAYLACSWTWCIGMFLPVLLVRDYGIWGFVVFAVPNVIGAGAMGWVLREGAAERISMSHALACRVFSYVTMAFQFWFMASFVEHQILDGVRVLPSWLGVIVGFLMVAVIAIIAYTREYGGWIAWLISALVLGVVLLHPSLPRQFPIPTQTHQGLLWLAPVCAFGFALCPYLDLTFLQARREQAEGPARASFGFGFAGLFLVMILGTLAYTPLLVLAIAEDGGEVPKWPLVLVGVHLSVQTIYTVAVHLATIGYPFKGEDRALLRGRLFEAAAVVVGLFVLMVACSFIPRSNPHTNLLWQEVVYRLFMSFYGLVFPAYVWLCMIPTRDGHSGTAGPRGRLKLMTLAVAVALAAPCYWLGFIEREEIWLAPGLGIVLMARLLIRGRATEQRDVRSEAQSPHSA